MSKKDFISSLYYDTSKNPNKNNSGKKTPLIKGFRTRLGVLCCTALVAATALSGCSSPKEPIVSPSIPDSIPDKQSFSSAEEVLNNFKGIYVTEYNKQHPNSKISVEQLEILESPASFLFLTPDGKFVTHGDNPVETESFLKGIYGDREFQKYSTLSIDQAIVNGKAIDIINGQNPVFSGNQLDTLSDNLNNNNYTSTLLKLNELFKAYKDCQKTNAEAYDYYGKYSKLVNTYIEQQKNTISTSKGDDYTIEF